jgi:cobyrinic acid a,c-diamide synthase
MEQTNLREPRILIAADRSSAGKTTIAVGLMSIFSKEGYVVQPFKVGLDYIDPSYHSEVTGRFSRNLDGFLMNRHAIIEVFSHAIRGADIGIIEGVRGLYEGLESLSDVGSSTPRLFSLSTHGASHGVRRRLLRATVHLTGELTSGE